MGANKHLEHIEDLILLEGRRGAEKALKILKDVAQVLTGTGGPSMTITTKWDGAPAVVCGIDPADGKFFVGSKSVFNKQDPKIAKTQSDVQRMYSGGLADKISSCLRYLPRVVTSGVLQGDLLFTTDKATKSIEGKSYVTFRPNTITYAAETNSPLGRDINTAQLGIVFHTSYSGNSIPEMNASFGVPASAFNSGGQVWATTATFTDVGNVAAFTSEEMTQFNAAIRMAEGSLTKSGKVLNQINTGGKSLQLDTEFKKFFNAFYRDGQSIAPVNQSYVQFARHLGNEYNKVISKNKTLKSQADKAFKFVEAIDFMEDNKDGMMMVIALYQNIIKAKNMIVNKMNRVGGLDTFVETSKGYKVTNQEGFVAVSGSQAIKLIDRLEFSNLNFNVPKVW